MNLTYGTLRDPNFGRAFGKTASFAGYKSPKIAINIAKLNKRLLEEAKLADEAHDKLLKQYAKLDEKGEILAENGRWTPTSDQAQKEYEEKLKEFNAYSFELPGDLLRVDDILPAGLSPLDLSFLDPLLAPYLEAVPPPANK